MNQMKPQRPAGGAVKNPRSTRIAGFEALLEELNKAAGTSSNPRPKPVLKDVSNVNVSSARRPKDEEEESVVSKQPMSAREYRSTETSNPPQENFLKGLSPSLALQKYQSALTDFERSEIYGFDNVYYVGAGARKVRSPIDPTTNNGFDDSKGDYRVVMDDHIAYRYQIVSELGRGSFGQVSKALDHKTGQYCALKIIKNKKKFHDQALVEVKILKHLNDGDPNGRCHNIRMLDSFIFRNHMVIIFELHGMNLYEMCKAQRFAPVAAPLMRSFAKQLLLALHNNHKEKIVHCDLKPENILLKMNSKSQLAVIDYGSACFESERLYTYIQSRFYRAPEVMLGIPYTTQIDVWSLGCILAELANGYPIFPGESEVEQMQCLMEVLGVPPRSMLDRAPRRKIFFDNLNTPRLVPNSRGRVRRPNSKDLKAFLKTTDDLFVDFVRGLLNYDPEKRLTPQQALQHPWMMIDAVEGSAQQTPRSTSPISSRPTYLPKAPPKAQQPIGALSGLLPMLPKRSNQW